MIVQTTGTVSLYTNSRDSELGILIAPRSVLGNGKQGEKNPEGDNIGEG